MISDLPDPQSIGRRRSIVRRVTVGGKFTACLLPTGIAADVGFRQAKRG